MRYPLLLAACSVYSWSWLFWLFPLPLFPGSGAWNQDSLYFRGRKFGTVVFELKLLSGSLLLELTIQDRSLQLLIWDWLSTTGWYAIVLCINYLIYIVFIIFIIILSFFVVLVNCSYFNPRVSPFPFDCLSYITSG